MISLRKLRQALVISMTARDSFRMVRRTMGALPLHHQDLPDVGGTRLGRLHHLGDVSLCD
jgi:hypothetical protein